MTPELPDLTGRGTEVAPLLVGCRMAVGEVVVRLVEVEAYEGADDPASHAWKGPTARNATMFGPAGRLYVYTMHGHACCNVVCGPVGEAQAVLLRAGEVIAGAELARARREAHLASRAGRPARSPADAALARGPGNLTRALGITLADDGADLLTGGRITLLPPDRDPGPVASGPRVNVSRAHDRPWRFVDPTSPSVSAFKPHANAAALRRPAPGGRGPAAR